MCVYIYIYIYIYIYRERERERKKQRDVYLSLGWCTYIHTQYKIKKRKLILWSSIIKGFQSIVFIFIVISTMFQLICPPACLRRLLNSGTYTELQTTSFIESTVVTCSDSVNHNQVQVLRIPVLLLACSQNWTCNLQMIVSLEA